MASIIEEAVIVLKITATEIAAENEEEVTASVKDAVASIFPDDWKIEIVES